MLGAAIVHPELKEGDHGFLFEHVCQAESAGQVTVYEFVDEATGVRHRYRFLNGVPLNESNQDLLINFLEYWEIRPDDSSRSGKG